MTAYDENLRKVADALFVKADPKADQNVWDMAREVLKTVPQKEFQPTTHTATNYFVQANQPMPPLPEWLKHNPAGVDPDTIIVDPSKVKVNLAADPVLQELANVMPSAENLPSAYKQLGQSHDALLRDLLTIRRLVGASDGSYMNETTVSAVKRMVASYEETRSQLLEIRGHVVDMSKALPDAVEDMVQELIDLRGKVALFQGDEAKIRQITEAEDSPSVDGEGQRESTVDAVNRLRETVNMLSGQLQEIRQHVGGHRALVAEVADMAKENNDFRTELRDTVETASAAKLLKLVEKFDGRTLMDKVGNAVTWAGTHQERSKDLQRKLNDLHSAVRSNQEELREILGAQEPSEDDNDNWSEGESLTEAARRVVRERDEATEANIRHSCDKEMAAKAWEIRAAFADQLAEKIKIATLPRTPIQFAEWLHKRADKERAEKEVDKP